MVEAATWDEYIECVRRYLATGRIDKDELNYKRQVARELGGVRKAARSGSIDWLDLLKGVTPRYVINLCGWRGRDGLLKWFHTDPDGALDALVELWAPYEQSSGQPPPTADVIERVRAFAGRLPQDVISGAGTRMRAVSFLLMGLDAERYPPFMTTTFAATYELTKYQGPPKDADEAALYEHALGFLDRLIEEADKLDRRRTRLEAQSAVFGDVVSPGPLQRVFKRSFVGPVQGESARRTRKAPDDGRAAPPVERARVRGPPQRVFESL